MLERSHRGGLRPFCSSPWVDSVHPGAAY